MPPPTDRSENAASTVHLGQRLGHSSHFKALFTDGIALVEEAAAYLDGPGRADAKLLVPAIAAAYSAESMRLTTRLMQVASWLLIRRAVINGEMTLAEAHAQQVKVTIAAQTRVSSAAVFAQLPAALRSLTDRSLQMQHRVLHLDRMVHQDFEPGPVTHNSALEQQHARLRSAYPAAR